jgi:hypothetical protein
MASYWNEDTTTQQGVAHSHEHSHEQLLTLSALPFLDSTIASPATLWSVKAVVGSRGQSTPRGVFPSQIMRRFLEEINISFLRDVAFIE